MFFVKISVISWKNKPSAKLNESFVEKPKKYEPNL